MDVIFVLIFILVFNKIITDKLSEKYTFFSKKLMNYLFLYHLVFLGVYSIYAALNSSDSFYYYYIGRKIGSDWDLFQQTGTTFVENFSAIFIEFGFSYISMMLLFSWLGYLGFIYAYLFFKENIPIDVKVFGKIDLMTLLLFFPNMHFWTNSLGKGAPIFMGLMMFTFAMKQPTKRLGILLIGSFFIYMIRPPVMFFALVGVMVGLLTGREKISRGLRLLIVIAGVVFLYAASTTILKYANLQKSENYIEDFQSYTMVASKRLQHSAGSGVAMTDYSIPMKLFTFWFRPLFVDSPGILGLFSSLENLIYLLLFLKIFNFRFLKFFRKSPYMVKLCAITFLTTSFALTFVMSNLGIMMRQKSMVMYFGFFVIFYFLAEEQWKKEQAILASKR